MPTKLARPGAPSTALGRLFAAKQAKVKTNARMTNLLQDFAEHDHKRIAKLLQAWLDDAPLESEQPGKAEK